MTALTTHTTGTHAVRKPGLCFLFFGVILPLFAVLFEVNTHFCAQHFFDPFPSGWHIVLFLLIPFSNFLVWLSHRRDLSPHYAFMSLANGMAVGIGCLYTLMFLPISPIACLYIAFFGFGLLGLAPLLSLPCSWLSGKSISGLASARGTYFDAHLLDHIGHLIILVMVIAVELPSTLTRVHLGMAAHAETAQQGISWLRKYGSQEVMLRACYERSGRATDILGSIYEAEHPMSVDEARIIFYRVTGKPFNSVPIPASARATIQHAGALDDPNGVNTGVTDEFDIDTDVAGETVSGVARGLSAQNSKITGTINGDALLANLTWSFDLVNEQSHDREARCKILLPPGAVVNRAVLTIDGWDYAAKVMSRSAARSYYQESIAARKDPLLVSVCGQDEILVQGFPVRKGINMKVSLSMVAPLTMETESKAALVLPTFIEKNFQANTPISLEYNDHKVTVNASDLATFKSILHVDRNPSVQTVSCQDPFQPTNIINHAITIQTYPTPEKLTIFVDGSVSMREHIAEITEALRALPASIPSEIKVIGDTVQLCDANTFSTVKFEGGQDNSTFVYDRLTGKQNDREAVLWIHSVQPIAKAEAQNFKYLLRSVGGPYLYEFQVAAGPNECLNFPEPALRMVRVERTGTISQDLKRLFASWNSENASKPSSSWTVVSESLPPVNPGENSRVLKDTSLAYLWAYQRVNAALKLNESSPEAASLASTYGIVTPISSATVVNDIPQLAVTPVKQEQATPKDFNLDDMNPVRHVETAISQAFTDVTEQLNRLNSYSGAGGSGSRLESDGYGTVGIESAELMPATVPPPAAPMEVEEKVTYPDAGSYGSGTASEGAVAVPKSSLITGSSMPKQQGGRTEIFDYRSDSPARYKAKEVGKPFTFPNFFGANQLRSATDASSIHALKAARERRNEVSDMKKDAFRFGDKEEQSYDSTGVVVYKRGPENVAPGLLFLASWCLALAWAFLMIRKRKWWQAALILFGVPLIVSSVGSILILGGIAPHPAVSCILLIAFLLALVNSSWARPRIEAINAAFTSYWEGLWIIRQ